MVNRRAVLAGSGALLAAGWMSSARADEADIFPVVETANGKVRGMVFGGVAAFKGLRYGDDTSDRNRFRAPRPVRKWSGVQDAFDYAPIAPQIPADPTRDYSALIYNDVHPGGMSEDCLSLNLWTTDPKPSAKKPVIVRFHGGGFYGGSSNTSGSDGGEMARFGDCVFINVNHRLSALGYLYLGDSNDFSDSGSVGMQDLVAALSWIRTNVDAFGGDPNRVLIFGQSGGGAKVSHLLGMPSATGLYHRAGVMSGARLTAMTREDAAEAADKLLAQLGLKRTDIRALQRLPFSTLLAAQAEVESEERSSGEAPRSFSPVMGASIPHHPFDPAAPPESADIPMIVSTVLDERTYRESNFTLGWDALAKELDAMLGDKSGDVLAMYRAEDGAASPFIIKARIITDRSFRRNADTMSDRKAAQAASGGEKVWKYLWTHPSEAFGGRYGAVHGLDVAPVQHSVRSPLFGPTAENLRLADQLAGAFAAFAATGDPNHDLLPDWPSYDLPARNTMVFGSPSNAVSDPRRAFRELWS